MNQILFINSKTHNNKKIYLCLFFISIIVCTFLISYLFHSYYSRIKEKQKTNILKNKYIISTLYASSNNRLTLEISNNISILGSIEIPKINISYPIIENTSEDLLKISVCRFTGPLPNRLGNLCIAGHNYKNNTMFSSLHKLNIGDSIYITDLNNTKLKYIVYNKFVVEENNLDCTQNSNNVEITLITCNNLDNSKRTIIKAKMEG